MLTARTTRRHGAAPGATSATTGSGSCRCAAARAASCAAATSPASTLSLCRNLRSSDGRHRKTSLKGAMASLTQFSTALSSAACVGASCCNRCSSSNCAWMGARASETAACVIASCCKRCSSSTCAWRGARPSRTATSTMRWTSLSSAFCSNSFRKGVATSLCICTPMLCCTSFEMLSLNSARAFCSSSSKSSTLSFAFISSRSGCTTC
mmetsp:Transcript_47139/g.108976  ORF Transcript_47139/g.108976 Transcript_47139/m.108976 type:complete len:209 (+) Transcript_47139:123-749(+)